MTYPLLARERRLLDLLASYDRIVLVANSEKTDLDALLSTYSADQTLFVFFGKVQKILTEPFARPAMLIHRLGRQGAINHGRRSVETALALFDKTALKGQVGLQAGKDHRSTNSAANDGDFSAELPFLMNCDPVLNGWYTQGVAPTTGFAAALWLSRHLPEKSIILAGFTGQRSLNLKMLSVHDWTIEQTVLRLEYRMGTISRFEDSGQMAERASIENIAERYPELPPATVAAVYADVLRGQFQATDKVVAHLSRDRWYQRIYNKLASRLGLRRRR
ncbi:hypothetical protein B7H23_13310 [Notoacmeibacter marinus]|uniref:3-deoxy-manno-octulosonate cytidylyltransferase n=1 Tax=Notoacmeibacter marinus TaxID=1876515 RepID=A0A231UTI1_9HYPH|nr:hypothetical protein [Notoacmeibacter marinus]OXS99171.1 hypothetical protein B7H23_13310 [Notoacmeibacter marinus]